MDFTQLKQHNNISQIIVGTPSIAENGIIRHCDIAELENVEIVCQLEKQFHIPVYLENDMHFKAYGYYSKCGKADEIITLANFPAHILPGTASVHAGMILKGKNHVSVSLCKGLKGQTANTGLLRLLYHIFAVLC